MAMYELQTRWKQQKNTLTYYGLRSVPNLFKNKIRLSKKQSAVIEKLPCELSASDMRALGSLLGEQVVLSSEKKKTPTTLEEAVFCRDCIANDYMIPGIEFDASGLCPMCQTKEATRHFKSVIPVMNTFPASKKSRFDVAVFYTGGKDSTYLLYYLSKVLGLRVLALTWEIPYMSECAKKSI